MSRLAYLPCLTFLALALAVTLTPARAADEDESRPATSGKTPSSSESKAEQDAEEVSPFVRAVSRPAGRAPVPVYGNDDLERMFGPPTPAAESETAVVAGGDAMAPAEAPPPDGAPAGEPSALDEMFAAEAGKQERHQQVGEAEKRVAEARQRVAEIEKRQLAVRNPFLARPEVSAEEAEAWNAADGEQRAAKTEQDLAAAREALAKAEQDLAALGGSAP
jgi:hypothetical protein